MGLENIGSNSIGGGIAKLLGSFGAAPSEAGGKAPGAAETSTGARPGDLMSIEPQGESSQFELKNQDFAAGRAAGRSRMG